MTSKTPLLISKSPKQKKNTEKPGLKRHFHKRDRKQNKTKKPHTLTKKTVKTQVKQNVKQQEIPQKRINICPYQWVNHQKTPSAIYALCGHSEHSLFVSDLAEFSIFVRQNQAHPIVFYHSSVVGYNLNICFTI